MPTTQVEVLPRSTITPEQEIALDVFAGNGVENLDVSDRLTREQAFSLLVGFCGLKGQVEVGQTFTFVYTDPETGKSNYQTACIPTHNSQVPFTVRFLGDKGASITSDHENVVHDVRLHAWIGKTTNHHYSRVDNDFNELPTAVIASPRSTCAAGCPGCSRGAVGFTPAPAGYIDDHVLELLADYEQRGWDPRDLASVNITTGSQPSEEKEVEMMVEIMDTYRKHGFDPRFMIYNYALRSKEAMKKVRDAGADGYIGTIETIDDDLRVKHWGKVKGGQTFDEHLRRYEDAHEVGFPIVETNYVVGFDPYDAMIDGIARLDQEGVAVVPNVLRSYNPSQFEAIHPDVWGNGFRYILDGFEGCLASYRNPTIKEFAGNVSVKWLVARGQLEEGSTYLDLPIRHT